MPVGGSGRIVIEIDPELKQELYRALSEQGLNLKQWFLINAKQYLDQQIQPNALIYSNHPSQCQPYPSGDARGASFAQDGQEVPPRAARYRRKNDLQWPASHTIIVASEVLSCGKAH